MRLAWVLVLAAACGDAKPNRLPDAPAGGPRDADIDAPVEMVIDAAVEDALVADAVVADAVVADAVVADAVVADAVVADAVVADAVVADALVVDAAPPADAIVTGPITGGPCISGAAGATAYRVRWAGNGSGSTAYVQYEVHAMPDTTRFRTGSYGYQIGYTPSFVDPFLGEGGVRLDSSSFIDIELSTVGIAQVSAVRLSLYGRSFATTSSGSFNWQTFEGTGATASNFVSNSAPYEWYTADMTGDVTAGKNNVLIRIKAGPSSGVLVVNRIEICMQAS